MSKQQLSPTVLAKHVSRILSRWPTDLLRPTPVSIQTYLKSRLQSSPSPSSTTSAPSSQPTTTTTTLPASSINALYTLLENRYQTRYPLPRSLRYPKSNPSYYDGLITEFKEAPGRSWWGGVKKRVSGFLRFK
ncbi:hypothetical protein AJ80_09772 [Polytolypa hystricis UAMH7299]|uniref:Uncharacterized protein n=1 Tax=Polytolypa hystricis (strain UAMH7299) TaxID=1447883 RepID=A0A2B7WJX1_POLH7|nr:hypothetical protein AJ80_09772 [Polytolypa hystricis UAMH7299]